MQDADPLILTAALDEASADTFGALRDRYFPATRNIVPAHLTLFHHLPGTEQAAIHAALRAEASLTLPFRADTLRFLGHGVAIEIDCPALAAHRQQLARHWQPWLTPQDRQGFRPHITVQNKVSSAQARATLDELTRRGLSLTGTIVGLDLWWYRGGPWEPAGTIRWAPSPSEP